MPRFILKLWNHEELEKGGEGGGKGRRRKRNRRRRRERERKNLWY